LIAGEIIEAFGTVLYLLGLFEGMIVLFLILVHPRPKNRI
jgi:hypothetical protein